MSIAHANTKRQCFRRVRADEVSGMDGSGHGLGELAAHLECIRCNKHGLTCSFGLALDGQNPVIAQDWLAAIFEGFQRQAHPFVYLEVSDGGLTKDRRTTFNRLVDPIEPGKCPTANVFEQLASAFCAENIAKGRGGQPKDIGSTGPTFDDRYTWKTKNQFSRTDISTKW